MNRIEQWDKQKMREKMPNGKKEENAKQEVRQEMLKRN